MRPAACLLIAFALGCGGTKLLEVKPLEESAPVVTGPKATADELAGTIPPLRTIVGARRLVPEKLVPPEPPPDPEPDFP